MSDQFTTIRTPWSQLEELKKSYTIQSVIQLEGSNTLITMTQFTITNTITGISKNGSKPRSKLSIILSYMLNHACQYPGRVQRHTLPNGLHIDLIYGIDGITRLQISRVNVPPAIQEWITIKKQFPESIPDATETFEHKKMHYMRASWESTTTKK